MSASRVILEKILDGSGLVVSTSQSRDLPIGSKPVPTIEKMPFQERCRILADMLAEHTLDERFVPCPLLSRHQMQIKRAMDLVFASIALAVFALPMAVISILIKLDSKGPIFYTQERIGLGGRRFRMLKFRSMRPDAESHTGAVWAIKDDPRRTRLGSFLRASSLDELPQIFNVFRGEMSMVGPRPERPHFVEEFRKEVYNYDLRHHVPVGITGWAQVHGWRGNTSIQTRVGYDIFYMLHWSPWLDIRTLFLTMFRGFINKNAY